MIKRYQLPKERRKARTRAKIKGEKKRPRLSVFRSNKYIYSQIIDDEKGKTLVAASESDLKKTEKHLKTEKARLVGKILAQKALKAGLKKIVFDRGPFKYHGRIKALAEGAREGGLVF